MIIEMFGIAYDGSGNQGAVLMMAAPDEPYSGTNRTVICVRPVTLLKHDQMDSGQIDGRFGLADRRNELPAMKDGRMAEFKTAADALEFARTLDLEHVSIDFERIMVLIPDDSAPSWAAA